MPLKVRVGARLSSLFSETGSGYEFKILEGTNKGKEKQTKGNKNLIIIRKNWAQKTYFRRECKNKTEVKKKQGCDKG